MEVGGGGGGGGGGGSGGDGVGGGGGEGTTKKSPAGWRSFWPWTVKQPGENGETGGKGESPAMRLSAWMPTLFGRKRRGPGQSGSKDAERTELTQDETDVGRAGHRAHRLAPANLHQRRLIRQRRAQMTTSLVCRNWVFTWLDVLLLCLALASLAVSAGIAGYLIHLLHQAQGPSLSSWSTHGLTRFHPVPSCIRAPPQQRCPDANSTSRQLHPVLEQLTPCPVPCHPNQTRTWIVRNQNCTKIRQLIPCLCAPELAPLPSCLPTRYSFLLPDHNANQFQAVDYSLFNWSRIAPVKC